MPIEHLSKNPEIIRMLTDQALHAAWAKNGQLTFQIDVMAQQLQAFEQENKKLQDEIEELKKPKDKTK